MAFRRDTHTDQYDVYQGGIPAERQTVLFSATLPHSIRAIAEKHLRNPKHVKVETKTQTVTAIEQAHLMVHADFNKHPELKLDRRLNIIIYLNRDWPAIGYTYEPYTPWSEPETRGASAPFSRASATTT